VPSASRLNAAAARRKAVAARRAELQFARALRKVARQCGILARKTFNSSRPMGSTQALRAALEKYGQLLTPWARATAKRMVLDVARRDEKFWRDQSKLMARNLKQEIRNAPTGIALRERTAEAAALITSLPLEAASRVEKLAVQYMTQGIRAKTLAKDIMRTGQVTQSRANTIARTETSRTAGILQQVRAESVGSEFFIWRTAEDIDVRVRHRRLAGRVFRWDTPPVAGENGERALPGGIYNCRCHAEPLLPGEDRPNRSRFVAEEVTPLRTPKRRAA
jgi:SPP1 gp7 family putative phage head morphogenesis protein